MLGSFSFILLIVNQFKHLISMLHLAIEKPFDKVTDKLKMLPTVKNNQEI